MPQPPIQQLIQVPKRLIDADGTLRLWEFCTHIHIAGVHTATLIGDRDDYVFGSDRMIRSATLTFVEFSGRCFAVTCRHVLASLDSTNQAARSRYGNETGVFEPDIDPYQFFTPIENRSIHFRYKLWAVPETAAGVPDVAIAEVSPQYVTSVRRRPMKITPRLGLPVSAIAAGYPEQQRKTIPKDKVNDFLSLSVANCLAYITEQSGRLVLSDGIDDAGELDILSGMSGGPIVWSDSKNFGLLGIVTSGLDIVPKESMDSTPGIAIFGEPITYELFEHWISIMPPTSALRDKSKCLISPPSNFR